VPVTVYSASHVNNLRFSYTVPLQYEINFYFGVLHPVARILSKSEDGQQGPKYVAAKYNNNMK
jgi:hypothetical protein